MSETKHSINEYPYHKEGRTTKKGRVKKSTESTKKKKKKKHNMMTVGELVDYRYISINIQLYINSLN